MDFQKSMIGLDEAGRGPWAGPVVAAAVWVKNPLQIEDLLRSLKDSKKLSAAKREGLFQNLQEAQKQEHIVISYGLGHVQEIDQYNILQATFKAMTRAYAMLDAPQGPLYIDGPHVPKDLVGGQGIVKGDALVPAISGASIVAKVIRDAMMKTLSKRYPMYGWAKNAGYGTKEHQEALKCHGVSPFHRRSFKPIQELLI